MTKCSVKPFMKRLWLGGIQCHQLANTGPYKLTVYNYLGIFFNTSIIYMLNILAARKFPTLQAPNE